MNISFTGTQQGMTEYQKLQLKTWLLKYKPLIQRFSHGCCIGADMEAHEIVREVCGLSVFIAVYPSNASTRAPIPRDADFVAVAEHPLERNKKIVKDGKDTLIAAPFEMREVLRSGTWATIRFARQVHVPIFYAWPFKHRFMSEDTEFDPHREVSR